MTISTEKKVVFVAVIAVLVCSAAVIACMGHQSSDPDDDALNISGTRTIIPSSVHLNSGVFKIGSETYRAGETINVQGDDYLIFGSFGSGLQLVRLSDAALFNWKNGELENFGINTKLDIVDENVIINGRTDHVGIQCHYLTIVDWKTVPGEDFFMVLTSGEEVIGTYSHGNNSISFNDRYV